TRPASARSRRTRRSSSRDRARRRPRDAAPATGSGRSGSLALRSASTVRTGLAELPELRHVSPVLPVGGGELCLTGVGVDGHEVAPAARGGIQRRLDGLVTGGVDRT